MRYVVDGYNAVRRVARLKDIESRDGLEAGRDALIAALASSGQRIVVFFDGADASHPSRGRSSVDVRFSRPPQNADQAIVSFVEKARDKERITVITADEELAFSVRRQGASVAAPETWPPLRPRKTPRAARSAARSDKPEATKKDVSYWLEVFGEDE